METPLTKSDPDYARIDALVRQLQQTFLDNFEQILQRQLAPMLERAQSAIVTSGETIIRGQAEPFLGRARELILETVQETVRRQVEPLVENTRNMLLQMAGEVVQRHAGPLVTQARAAFEQALEGLLQRRLEPLLDRARTGLEESAPLAAQFADAIVSRLQSTLTQPAEQMLLNDVPEFAQRAGRRVLDYLLAGTLFTLSAIFLLVGGVLGLQELGLPPFATYGIGGLVALAGGLIFLRLWRRPLPRIGSDSTHKSI